MSTFFIVCKVFMIKLYNVMSKIIVTESELKNLISESVKDILNESQENESVGAALGLGVAAGAGYGAYKNFIKGNPTRNLSKALVRGTNVFRKKENRVQDDDYYTKWSWQLINKPQKDGDESVDQNDIKGGEKEFGKPEVDFSTNKMVKYTDANNNLPFIDDSDRKCLNGHYVGVDDADENNGKLKAKYDKCKQKVSSNASNTPGKYLSVWLTQRDKYFESKKTIEEGKLSTIRNGIMMARGLRKMNNKDKEGMSILNNRQVSLRVIENQILPEILNFLCVTLSIEKEDPMYTMITSKETRKKIMKNIERNL